MKIEQEITSPHAAGRMTEAEGARTRRTTETGGAMAAGWVVDEQGRLMRATKHHMGRRMFNFDYSQRRIYEITIVLEERQPILGALVKRGKGDWAVEPSKIGEVVLACWREIEIRWPQVELIAEQLMPDHFHGVLFVKEQLPKGKSLGNIIGSFKSRSTSEALKILAARGEAHNSAARGEAHNSATCGGAPNSATCGGASNGGSVPSSARGRVRPRFWAEGYVDTILSGKGQLARMINYLRDNARRLGVKRAHPELFKVTRELKIEGVGRISAIGNHFLLTRPVFHQVQVSRRFFAYAHDARGHLLKDAPPAVATAEFHEKLALALAAGRGGAVLISPCISQGEREIARQAFVVGYRVITFANKGFSPLYKPGGKLFDICAAGNLLMLAPIGWPYQPAEKPMTRVDALVLNRIAQLLAGEGACPIDYKGAKLVYVDDEVKKAVL